MFYHNISPVLLRLGSLEIRYYGLMYLVSFLIVYFMLKYLAKKRKLKLKPEDIDEISLYTVLSIILGARIFYILVYNLKFYLSNPFEMIAIWHGGLSFHGGLIGGVIFIYFYCKKKNIDLYTLLDLLAIPFGLALMLGRIGNFINGELYGRITDLPWAVKFNGVEGPRHPSQLYEASKNLLIFIVMWNLKDKKLPKGFLFWLFIVMYSVLRFFIEFVREPDPQLGFFFSFLTMGQILNIIMFVVGLVFLFRQYLRKLMAPSTRF